MGKSIIYVPDDIFQVETGQLITQVSVEDIPSCEKELMGGDRLAFLSCLPEKYFSTHRQMLQNTWKILMKENTYDKKY